MTARTLVVTGTDTGVGKTAVACALLRGLRARGKAACGFKPVQTGSDDGDDDSAALQAAAGTQEPHAAVNPYAFGPAIAPHVAALRAGQPIRVGHLDMRHAALARRHEVIVLEGAGGWRVPLDDTWTFESWVAEHQWPVLLVVGMRLGCINHALLSAEAIARRTRLAAWVANVLPPEMPALQENLETLRSRLSAPCAGVIAAGAQSTAENAIDFKCLPT